MGDGWGGGASARVEGEAFGAPGTAKHRESALLERLHTLVPFILHAVGEEGVERGR